MMDSIHSSQSTQRPSLIHRIKVPAPRLASLLFDSGHSVDKPRCPPDWHPISPKSKSSTTTRRSSSSGISKNRRRSLASPFPTSNPKFCDSHFPSLDPEIDIEDVVVVASPPSKRHPLPLSPCSSKISLPSALSSVGIHGEATMHYHSALPSITTSPRKKRPRSLHSPLTPAVSVAVLSRKAEELSIHKSKRVAGANGHILMRPTRKSLLDPGDACDDGANNAVRVTRPASEIETRDIILNEDHGDITDHAALQRSSHLGTSQLHCDLSPAQYRNDDDDDKNSSLQSGLEISTCKVTTLHPDQQSASSSSGGDLSTSVLNSESSKATTPMDAEPSIVLTPSLCQPPPSAAHKRPGRQFNVGPKSSIPPGITRSQYIGQCVEAAESCRLNPYGLHPDENLLLRAHMSHAQVKTYLTIRNGILRLWMSNPLVAVTRARAVGCAKETWFDVASVCFDWLIRRGYINYGCVRVSPGKVRLGAESFPQKTVAIIGAGMSGLGCARQLEALFLQYSDAFYQKGERPPKVVVIEGRSRIGGRLYSHGINSEPSVPFAGARCTADLGGMIITGFQRGNPLNVLVRGQLGLPYVVLKTEMTLYDSDGKRVDMDRDLMAEKLYNYFLDRVSEYRFKATSAKTVTGNTERLDDGGGRNGQMTIGQVEMAAAEIVGDDLGVSRDIAPIIMNHSSDIEPWMRTSLHTAQSLRAIGWPLRIETADDARIDLSAAAQAPDATLGSVLDEAISQCPSLIDLTAQDYRLLNWHVANLEYSNANSLHALSLDGWDIDAGNEWEGKHTMIVGGYQAVARGLFRFPSALNVSMSRPIGHISYQPDLVGDGPAVLTCDDGSTVAADYVVCTIPLGVLKQKDAVTFEPPLPAWKSDAISRLGFGVLNKVFLVYESPFWDTSRHIFGVLREPADPQSLNQSDYASRRGRFFQWFNVSETTGVPCLVGLMAGEAGFDAESANNGQLVAEATEVLRGIFGSTVPLPVECIITRWGHDRFAYGSYSSAGPSMWSDDYDSMAKPVGNLFFAGEHTMGTHPATVHGAYLSGLRAASQVLEVMIGPIEVPVPLILRRELLSSSKPNDKGEQANMQTANGRQPELDARELDVRNYVESRLGPRPEPPLKGTSNAYLLYAKARAEANRTAIDEMAKGLTKPWRQASDSEREPFNRLAADIKQANNIAYGKWAVVARGWDRNAAVLEAEYDKEHPIAEAMESPAPRVVRRTRQVNYIEEYVSDSN